MHWSLNRGSPKELISSRADSLLWSWKLCLYVTLVCVDDDIRSEVGLLMRPPVLISLVTLVTVSVCLSAGTAEHQTKQTRHRLNLSRQRHCLKPGQGDEEWSETRSGRRAVETDDRTF